MYKKPLVSVLLANQICVFHKLVIAMGNMRKGLAPV